MRKIKRLIEKRMEREKPPDVSHSTVTEIISVGGRASPQQTHLHATLAVGGPYKDNHRVLSDRRLCLHYSDGRGKQNMKMR
jgi:hypothetical protein